MPEWLITWLQSASWLDLIVVFTIENLAILAIVLIAGRWLIERFSCRRVAPAPDEVTSSEVTVALINVLLNTVTTLVGVWLWRIGFVHFREDFGLFALMDVIALVLVMDLAMYLLHRTAHIPVLYRLFHQFHHKYERVRPLTLFALNPFENLAFGGLWLTVICLYDASWLGMSLYLVLNVFFGAIGHLGVEIFPLKWAKRPVLRHLAGGSFHAQHHQDEHHNFGFYTLIWDRLLGTLKPDYEQNYGHLPEETPN
jgi:sterol desaturase/sphingolipid hydroxylase (fatty acid hydroxylase superfamily)